MQSPSFMIPILLVVLLIDRLTLDVLLLSQLGLVSAPSREPLIRLSLVLGSEVHALSQGPSMTYLAFHDQVVPSSDGFEVCVMSDLPEGRRTVQRTNLVSSDSTGEMNLTCFRFANDLITSEV